MSADNVNKLGTWLTSGFVTAEQLGIIVSCPSIEQQLDRLYPIFLATATASAAKTAVAALFRAAATAAQQQVAPSQPAAVPLVGTGAPKANPPPQRIPLTDEEKTLREYDKVIATSGNLTPEKNHYRNLVNRYMDGENGAAKVTWKKFRESEEYTALKEELYEWAEWDDAKIDRCLKRKHSNAVLKKNQLLQKSGLKLKATKRKVKVPVTGATAATLAPAPSALITPANGPPPDFQDQLPFQTAPDVELGALNRSNAIMESLLLAASPPAPNQRRKAKVSFYMRVHRFSTSQANTYRSQLLVIVSGGG